MGLFSSAPRDAPRDASGAARADRLVRAAALVTVLVLAPAALKLARPLAWVWGFLTFLLEYIPSVGSVLAVVPPTLMGFAEGGGGRGLAVFLTVGTLQVVLGNVVDPKIEGRLMQLSPFAVLLAILVWGWLWGAVGEDEGDTQNDTRGDGAAGGGGR